MRRDGIPYIPNVGKPPRPIPLEEMDLQTVTKLRLRNCLKSNGLVSVCRDCETKCADGKRALELLYGNRDPVLNAPSGSTILERMKQEKESTPQTQTIVRGGKKYKRMDGWYEKAAKQDDPLEWIMSTFEISRTQAKKKISNWNNQHNENLLLEPSGKKIIPQKKEQSEPKKEIHVEAKPVEAVPKETPITPDEVMKDNENFAAIMRKKIEILTADRVNYKQQAEVWMALYKSVDEKITALTMALEAFSE